MYRAAMNGFINATVCADYLVNKGVPFREAHAVVGKLVNYCIKNGKTLETLELSEYIEYSPQFCDDVYAAIDLIACVKRRTTPGGPAEQSVLAQIESMEGFLKRQSPRHPLNSCTE